MKKALAFFLIGFLFLVPAISFVSADVGGNPGGDVGGNPGGFGLKNPLAGGVDNIFDFLKLVLNNVLLPIAAIIVVMYIIYAGFLFVTARGVPAKITEAKNHLQNALIGTAILFGAVAIAYAITSTICEIAPDLQSCPDIEVLRQ